MSATAGTFAATFVALYAAHEVGDHWIQTHHQACGKAAPGWTGRLLCARHVATLTLVKAAALGLATMALALPLNPYAVAAALAVDAISHYWADRRTTLQRFADWLGRTLVPGKGEFARFGDGAAAPTGTGAYALDQSWHIGFLFLSALIATLGAA
jgi:hypothetical protein